MNTCTYTYVYMSYTQRNKEGKERGREKGRKEWREGGGKKEGNKKETLCELQETQKSFIASGTACITEDR